MKTEKPLVIHFGTSKKQDGQMLLVAGEEAKRNRELFFNSIGINPQTLISTDLVHGNHVELVTTQNAGGVIKDTDGLVTNQLGPCLTVTISDCLPIFAIDHEHHAIGIAHAGWRGVVKNIPKKLVSTMNNAFGTDPLKLEIYIGPHIHACHFEIHNDVLVQFRLYQDVITQSQGKLYVDLSAIVSKELLQLGVITSHIRISPTCTVCDENYFSYRRDKPESVQSQIAYICMT